MNTITETPLTREEIATYINYYNEIMKTVLEKFADVTTKQDKEITNLRAELNSSVKTFSDDIKDLIKEQTKQQGTLFTNINETIVAIKNQQDTLKESFNTPIIIKENIKSSVSKEMSILSSYKSADNISKWVNLALNRASSLATIMEITRGVLLNIIYKEISEELQRDDINFDKLVEEYCASYGKKSKINIIGNSDVLRLLFEKKFDNYYWKYVLNSKIVMSVNTSRKKGSHEYRTIAARKVPDDIMQLLEIVMDDKDTVMSILRKIYKRMRSKHNINLDDWVNECCKKNNLKSCCIAYAINSNEEYMKKFREVIKEMSKEK